MIERFEKKNQKNCSTFLFKILPKHQVTSICLQVSYWLIYFKIHRNKVFPISTDHSFLFAFQMINWLNVGLNLNELKILRTFDWINSKILSDRTSNSKTIIRFYSVCIRCTFKTDEWKIENKLRECWFNIIIEFAVFFPSHSNDTKLQYTHTTGIFFVIADCL